MMHTVMTMTTMILRKTKSMSLIQATVLEIVMMLGGREISHQSTTEKWAEEKKDPVAWLLLLLSSRI